MFADVGFFLLFCCAMSSAYSFCASVAAGKLRHLRLFRSARMASTATFVMALTAAAIMWYSLFQRDYTIAYIAKNSSNDLPTLYRITAFWSSLEGSHMLWTLLLSMYGCIAVWVYSKTNEHILPYVNAAIQIVLAWMFWLSVTHSDLFARLLPAPANGQGMNALLQNFYMAIHPPTLFTGYTLLAVPYAYGVAALCYGDITEGWLKTTRRWTMVAWCALTAGIFLGGRWAYVELGWAGYWAWDPVENSSFMPWLFATALLHSLVVQEKLGHLKRLTIILSFLAFFMSFFGTFITRSGVITSVHSFAESNIGMAYLGFLSALMLGVILLYVLRADSILPPEAGRVWGISKESALIVTQFLILTFAAIVFIGTIYPIVSEALVGQRTSVQAPYFNSFAPWIGLGFIVAITIGNLMRYHVAILSGGVRLQAISLLIAIGETALFGYFGDFGSTTRTFALGAQIVGAYLAFWAINCLIGDFLLRLKDLNNSFKLMVTRNAAYMGGLVAHIGMMVAILGFLGNYRGVYKEVTLKKGESSQLYGYDFKFQGMTKRRDLNATLFEAPLQMSRNGEDLGVLTPARSMYPTKAELMNEIGLRGGFWHDIYAVIADFDKTNGDQVTLQIHINPTVRVVWMSAFLMVIGGLIALTDRHRGLRSRDAVASQWETR